MAKTPKLKTKLASLNSRAARRATSPSLNLDKSLKNARLPEENGTNFSNTLSAHHNSGISKKKAKAKTKSRAQRLRLEKGMERAEIVMDRIEKKVEKSVGRGKTIKERRSNWEDLNERIEGKRRSKKGAQLTDGREPVEMGEVEMEGESGDGVPAPVDVAAAIQDGPRLVVVNRTATAEPEDEIT